MNHLTDRELRCVRFLAHRYKTTDRLPDFVRSAEIPKENDETHDDIKHLVQRMSLSHLVEWDTNESFRIKPRLLDLAHHLDNPPPRNYWNEWSTWWLSKRWLVAVSVLIFIAPIIAQWIEWIIALWSSVNP